MPAEEVPRLAQPATPADPTAAPETPARREATRSSLSDAPPSLLPGSPTPRFQDAPRSAVPEAREAPTIHVSIGRVEVRAVTPPKPQPASQRAPALTLDAYLKRFGGSG
jgi:hypothetical protein